MPIMERELVNGRGWLSTDDLLEYYTIGQITPGIIAVNIASFIGYKQKKIPGAITATAGFVLPGVIMIMLAALLLRNFSEIPVVRNAFAGIRIVVGALILQTVVKLGVGIVQKNRCAVQNLTAVAICVVCFVLSLIWQSNPVLLVSASGLAGFFCFRNGKSGRM